MPAPFTVQLIDEPAHPTRFRANANGYEGERWYLVGTDAPDLAISPTDSPGIPQQYDPWDLGQYKDVRCVSVEAERWGGRDQGARFGSCWVRANYATPNESYEVQPTEPGTKWSEIAISSTTQTLRVGLDEDDTATPIENGDGFNVNVGIIQYIVTRNWPLDYVVGTGYLNTLTALQAFNSEDVTIPPLLGTTGTILLAEDTAQYIGYTAQVVGKSLRIQHTLAVGLSPRHTWLARFPDGSYADKADAYETLVYPSRSFAGLW